MIRLKVCVIILNEAGRPIYFF